MSRVQQMKFPPQRWIAAAPPVGATMLALLSCSAASAAPSVEDVFKSVGDNVNQTADPSRLLALLLGAAGIVMILALLGLRKKRQVMPKAVNHQGKLLREICRSVEIKPAQLRKLKALADDYGQKHGQPLQSPLTLLLCPSLLAETMKGKSGR